MEQNKNRFVTLLKSTKREGTDNMLKMLENMGFFTAPASTRFHLCCEGGLLLHSLNVCDMALDIREVIIRRNPAMEQRLSAESVIIASLLHDVCKADIYKHKNINAIGSKILGKDLVSEYTVDHGQFPFGHGEKSVILLLMNGLKLTNDEALAIRWHMHAWDLPFQSYDIKGNINKAKEICPLVQLLIAADGLASQILEGKE